MNDWVYDLQRFAEGDAAQGTEANTPAASEGQGVSCRKVLPRVRERRPP